MGRPFQIAAASATLRLNSKGQGQLTFTVSNVSGGSVRGRGRLVHQDPTSQAWVSLPGEPEQDFPAGETKQFPVKITVPAASKAGHYAFRLLVVSVQNPDEDYAEGPTIAFEVKEQAQKKPFPWWIPVVGGAVLLIIGGLVLYFVLRNKPTQKASSGETTSGSSSPPASTGRKPNTPRRR